MQKEYCFEVTTSTQQTWRIFGIDPSVDNLGIAVLDVDINQDHIAIIHGKTLYSAHLISTIPGIVDRFGDRAAKVHAYRLALSDYFKYYRPDVVIYESPFLGRFPNSFEALVQCKTAITEAAIDYDSELILTWIPPANAKMCIGVNPHSSDKQEIRNAIDNLENLSIQCPYQALYTEHTYDAIAVAYSVYKRWKEGL